MFSFYFFFFNDTATTEIYTLSLHDALPILKMRILLTLIFLMTFQNSSLSQNIFTSRKGLKFFPGHFDIVLTVDSSEDRKSTRLNSSHANISYAVFCLKKKKQQNRSHYSQH